jgi:hypothetical protein
MKQIKLSELLPGKALQLPEFFVRNIPNILPFGSGPLGLSHIAKVPVFDQDIYDFDFSDAYITIKDNLMQWLINNVTDDD